MPPPPARRVRGRLALLIIAAACLLLAARAQTPAQPAAAAHSRSLSGLPVATIADNSPFPASSSSAIVVGAGISGLSAADALCAKGFPVTVLEGRARSGGRTFTAKLPLTGATIDVGAGWIHDAVPTRNSVAKFVSDNGIATQTDDEEGLAWLVGGAPPTAAQIATGAQQAAWEATQEDFQDLIGNAEDNWQANLPLQKYYSDWVSSKGLQGDAKQASRTLLQSESADLEYGATAAKISAKFCDEGEQGEGPEKIITEGYSAVIEALLSRIRSRASCRNAIVLDAQVAEIITVASPAASRGVRVVLKNGTTLSANFAITTLPLGVLKQPGLVKFTPGLTAAKTDAISKLGVGLLNKIALVYDRPFFTAPGAGGAARPAAASWMLPVQSASNPTPPVEGDAFEWWNHARFWPGSNAVVMLLGADTAANWEALDPTLSAADRDRALATRADALFRQLFPNAGTPPVLREYLVTRWNSDPFAYGSYSYMAVGATPGMRTELCATQSDLLWWAGEHCSTVYPSTVQGALDTGVAAAEAAMAKFPAPATGRR